MNKLILALVFCLVAAQADAASKFWVGGTGTWDSSTTTHWATSTGGAGGTAVPTTGDTVTFDGSSGGGTVSVSATITGLSLASITMTAFTGTIDFSVGNPTLTLTTGFIIGNGTEGTRTLTLGTSTFNLTGVNTNIWDATSVASLTLSAASSIVTWQPASLAGTATFVAGAKSWGTFTIGPTSFATPITVSGSGSTFAGLNLTGPVFRANLTNLTITNAINWAGSSSGLVSVASNSTSSTLTLSAIGTITWAAIGGITFATNIPAATNSFSLGNTNATITNPSVGVGHIIGG